MSSLLLFLLLIFVPTISVWIVSKTFETRVLNTFAGMFMVFVAILGGKYIDVLGLTTNIGSVFFGLFTFVFTLIFFKEGGKKSQTVVRKITIMLALTLFCISISASFPTIKGNENFSSALLEVQSTTLRIIVASFVSFYFIQSFFVLLLQKFSKKRKNILLPILIMQIIDSLIFYSVAFFGTMPFSALLHFGFDGLIVKTIVAVLTLPFLYF